MKVLITGATGFIGGALAKALLNQGYTVKGLARANSDTPNLKKLGIQIVNGDLRDAVAMNEAVRDCQSVYHIAAAMTNDRLSKKEYYAHNVAGTKNVARAALDAGVGRFIYASSVAVYGTIPNSSTDENTPPTPDTYYGETKLGGEREVLRLHRDHGLPVVVARLRNVYGPGSRSWVELCRKIAQGSFRIIGTGENQDRMIYLDDLVDTLQRCGEVPGIEGRTYVITGPEQLKLRQILERLAIELKADTCFRTVPATPFWLYHRLGGLVYRTFGIQLPRSDYYNLFFINHIFETSKAQKELGHFPKVSLSEGLHRMLEWYREKGYLPSTNGY